jgi:uncharacterized membrane protein YvlD (DUF360 family)
MFRDMRIGSETLCKITDQSDSIIILFGWKGKSEAFWHIVLFLLHWLVTPVSCSLFSAIHQFHQIFVVLFFLLSFVNLRVSVQNVEIMLQMPIIFLVLGIFSILYRGWLLWFLPCVLSLMNSSHFRHVGLDEGRNTDRNF